LNEHWKRNKRKMGERNKEDMVAVHQAKDFDDKNVGTRQKLQVSD
jgi:hypothetical protein